LEIAVIFASWAARPVLLMSSDACIRVILFSKCVNR
jgi:hypothetical protein